MTYLKVKVENLLIVQIIALTRCLNVDKSREEESTRLAFVDRIRHILHIDISSQYDYYFWIDS